MDSEKKLELIKALVSIEDTADTLTRKFSLLSDCAHGIINSSHLGAKKQLAQLGTLSEVFVPDLESELVLLRKRIKEAREALSC